jgi:hypothetical protein
MIFPEITAENGNAWCEPLGLPTGRQQPRKFRLVT